MCCSSCDTSGHLSQRRPFEQKRTEFLLQLQRQAAQPLSLQVTELFCQFEGW